MEGLSNSNQPGVTYRDRDGPALEVVVVHLIEGVARALLALELHEGEAIEG